MEKYTGPTINDGEGIERYVITVTHPDASRDRSFTGILYQYNWEFERSPCFYVGNQQGGPIYEVEEPNDSVIEGDYEDYRVGGLFETEYKYTRFENNLCIA